MAEILKLGLLGPVEIQYGAQDVELRLRKGQALLAILALEARPVARDQLVEMLWPEQPGDKGRAALRRALHRVQAQLPHPLIRASDDCLELDPDVTIECDAHQVTARLEGDLGALDVTELEQVISLFRGEFTTGLSVPDCGDFSDWQLYQRQRFSQLLVRALDALVARYQGKGELQAALKHALRRCQIDPLDERGEQQVLSLLVANGDRSGAKDHLQRYQQRLHAELGIEPRAQTIALVQGDSIDAGQRPQIRYAPSADVYIAHQVFGEGPVDLVLVPGFISHLEVMWEDPQLSHILQRFARKARVVTFDRRGIGLSDRVGSPPTVENTATDILALMDHLGSQRAVICGLSEGGPCAIHFAVHHPERVAGLVLIASMAKGTRTDDYPWALREQQYDAWLEQFLSHWGSPEQLHAFAPSGQNDPRMRSWWARLLRQGATPGTIRGVFAALRDIDVRALLPRVKVPSLVIHRSGDRAILVGAGRYMAAHLPDCTYRELPGEDHLWWRGDSEPVVLAVEKLLREVSV